MFSAELATDYMRRAMQRELDRLTKTVTIIGDGSGVAGIQCSYCRAVSTRSTSHCVSCGAPYTPKNRQVMQSTDGLRC